MTSPILCKVSTSITEMLSLQLMLKKISPVMPVVTTLIKHSLRGYGNFKNDKYNHLCFLLGSFLSLFNYIVFLAHKSVPKAMKTCCNFPCKIKTLNN